MTNADTARDLIARSISHDEIAHAPYTDDLARALKSACGDYVDAGAVVEVWGERGGETWRVHLDRAAD